MEDLGKTKSQRSISLKSRTERSCYMWPVTSTQMTSPHILDLPLALAIDEEMLFLKLFEDWGP